MSGLVFLNSELAKFINLNPILIRPEMLQRENLVEAKTTRASKILLICLCQSQKENLPL